MAFTRKYDREIMESEEGTRLYVHWQGKVSKNTDDPEFATFLGFYKWAMESGFAIGAQLYRRDPKAPYSSDNCVWIAGEKRIRSEYLEFEKRWNDTVNRIRRYYGMEPFDTNADKCSTEVGESG